LFVVVFESIITRFRSRPIPLAEIRAKAYEIWQAQGSRNDNPDANWQAAIDLLETERAIGRRNFILELVRLIITSLGTTATIFGGIVLFLNFSQGENRLITERFTRSIEQLGNREETIRIGGIYALERIANDSPRDRLTILEVLSSFIRGKQIIKTQDYQQLPSIRPDSQAALTAVARRTIDSGETDKILDLSFTNLRDCNLYKASLARVKLTRSVLIGADLREANLNNATMKDCSLAKANLTQAILDRSNLLQVDLSNANLTGTSLRQTNLNKANLNGTMLDRARLDRASISSATLANAILIKADLRQTNLSKSNLTRVDFSGANLYRTDFTEANVNKADFRNALNLTVAQIKQAQNWQLAIYDPEFDREVRAIDPPTPEKS
jgi:uncharacterized protein YjbI with pentapeptide repeats